MTPKPLWALACACAYTPLLHAAQVITPTYFLTQLDNTWEHQGNGSYTVDTSAESYLDEVWERSIEDKKYSQSGSTLTTTGKYYAYGDIQSASFGFDDDYLYVRFEVVGDFEHIQGESNSISKGLIGKYHFYFSLGGDDTTQNFLFYLEDGLNVSSEFSAHGKVYKDVNGDANSSTGGSKVGDGFESEVAADRLQARKSGNVMEIAIKMDQLNISKEDFDVPLDYIHAGVAISNPSGKGDVFANNYFAQAAGSGVEYDTVKFSQTAVLVSIPEPASALFSLIGAGCMAMRRRRS